MLGARYAPCMRRDERLFDLIEQDRVTESMSGCCIRNDGSGCAQLNSATECNNNVSVCIISSPSPVCEQHKINNYLCICINTNYFMYFASTAVILLIKHGLLLFVCVL